MRRPIDPLLGLRVAGVLCLTVVPLLAQTATGVFEGRAAFGDWRADRPGVRRLIKPRDLPPPQPKTPSPIGPESRTGPMSSRSFLLVL